MISIQIKGLNKTNGFLRRLPIRMRRELNITSGEFMKAVRKSAKLMAPRDTGELANSIVIRKDGRTWILEVQSPYGIFQEEGFTPHWIHSDMIKGSRKLTRKGFYFVKRYKPFVTPAMERNLSKLSQGLNRAVNKAVERSKR